MSKSILKAVAAAVTANLHNPSAYHSLRRGVLKEAILPQEVRAARVTSTIQSVFEDVFGREYILSEGDSGIYVMTQTFTPPTNGIRTLRPIIHLD